MSAKIGQFHSISVPYGNMLAALDPGTTLEGNLHWFTLVPLTALVHAG